MNDYINLPSGTRAHPAYALQVKIDNRWKFVSYSTSYDHADELIWEDSIIDAAAHIEKWKEYEARIVRRYVTNWEEVK